MADSKENYSGDLGSERVDRSCVICPQVDVAFLRAARAGNLEKVRNFLNEEGDIHTCNAVSRMNFFCCQDGGIDTSNR